MKYLCEAQTEASVCGKSAKEVNYIDSSGDPCTSFLCKEHLKEQGGNKLRPDFYLDEFYNDSDYDSQEAAEGEAYAAQYE